jgi:hypothetical protein
MGAVNKNQPFPALAAEADLKGHGFSHAVNKNQSSPALAAEARFERARLQPCRKQEPIPIGFSR